MLGKLVEGGVVEFGAVSDFFGHKPADESRAEQKRQKQAGQKCCDIAEDDFLIGVETQAVGEDITQVPKKVVNHFISVFRDR